mgnify:CR=1 FL=1
MEINDSELLWSTDFKSTSTFDMYWNFDIGDGSQYGLTGWGNHELEYYTRDSVAVGSKLVIEAKNTFGLSDLECYYGKALWTSGKIHTAGKVSFKYGRIQVKAKAPKGVGTWPAIWLLGCELLKETPWPNCGEIDILETTGKNPNQIQGTIHGPEYFGESGLTKIIQSEKPLSDDYHIYAIDWLPDQITWLFDGQIYNSISRKEVEENGSTWPFNNDFYLILNLAIGGWFAGEVDPNLTEAIFEVESIQHFKIKGVGEVFLN